MPFNCKYSQKVEEYKITFISINNEKTVSKSESCMSLKHYIEIKEPEKRKFELTKKENMNYSTTALFPNENIELVYISKCRMINETINIKSPLNR